jgi:hypothetical protein
MLYLPQLSNKMLLIYLGNHLRPPNWSSGEIILLGKYSIFLLDAEQWFFVSTSFKDLFSNSSEVSVSRFKWLKWNITPYPSVTKYKDVIALSEGILEHSDWFQDYFRVMSWRLICGRPIIVPFGHLWNISRLCLKCPTLASESYICAVDPDILSRDWVSLLKLHELSIVSVC